MGSVSFSVFGNITAYLDRNIVTIKYNLLNLPIPAPLSSRRGAGGEVPIQKWQPDCEQVRRRRA